MLLSGILICNIMCIRPSNHVTCALHAMNLINYSNFTHNVFDEEEAKKNRPRHQYLKNQGRQQRQQQLQRVVHDTWFV
jgi:hypothetical protein